MAEKLSMPDNLKPIFDQMMRMAPDELCEDEQFQKSILINLKIGGVKLARQRIKVLTTQFCSGFKLVKPETGENDIAGQADEEKSETDTAAPEATEDPEKTLKESKNEHSASDKG